MKQQFHLEDYMNNEHKRAEKQFNICDDIIYVLTKHIQRITKDKWKSDPCPPKFDIFLDNSILEQQKIIITVEHLGGKFAEILFPRSDALWGYDSIENLMVSMYNKTM